MFSTEGLGFGSVMPLDKGKQEEHSLSPPPRDAMQKGSDLSCRGIFGAGGAGDWSSVWEAVCAPLQHAGLPITPWREGSHSCLTGLDIWFDPKYIAWACRHHADLSRGFCTGPFTAQLARDPNEPEQLPFFIPILSCFGFSPPADPHSPSACSHPSPGKSPTCPALPGDAISLGGVQPHGVLHKTIPAGASDASQTLVSPPPPRTAFCLGSQPAASLCA